MEVTYKTCNILYPNILYNFRLYSKQDRTIVVEKKVWLRDESPPSNWNRFDITLCSEKLVIHDGHWIMDIYNYNQKVLITNNNNISTSINAMYRQCYNNFMALFDKPLKSNRAPHWFTEAPHNLINRELKILAAFFFLFIRR